MARIPYPDPKTLAPGDRQLLESLPQLNISKLLAGSPSMFQPLTRVFSAYLNNGILDPKLREIAILRVGYRRESDYEITHHKRAASVVGLSEDRIAALEPGNKLDVFNSIELDVIKYVDELVQLGKVSSQVFDQLRKSLDDKRLIELTVVVGVYTMVSQICSAFELELEEEPIASTGMEDIGKALDKL
ncbi:MAG: carboxymuconolactone decarboxylase family protein [Pseudomonadota bacterium]|nr:carboxymuconolactone decarboxylase family protein [Pseudomonadota bacterium]